MKRNIVMVGIVFGLLAAIASAPAAEPLYRQAPFDELKLDETNNNALLKVKPLNLPGRKVPAPGVRNSRLAPTRPASPGDP